MAATAVLAARGADRDEILTLVGPFGQKGGESDPRSSELVDSAIAKFAGRDIPGDEEDDGSWSAGVRRRREGRRRSAPDQRGGDLSKFKPILLSSCSYIINDSWRIKGLMPAKGLAVIYGEPGCGKSFCALHACLHIAGGLH